MSSSSEYFDMVIIQLKCDFFPVKIKATKISFQLILYCPTSQIVNNSEFLYREISQLQDDWHFGVDQFLL